MSSTRRFMVLAAVLSGAALAAPATVFGAATSETGEMADTVQPVTFWIAGTTQAPNNELGPDLMQNKWIQENFGIAPTVIQSKAPDSTLLLRQPSFYLQSACYPLGKGSVQIRPSIAPNSLWSRCLYAKRSQ